MSYDRLTFKQERFCQEYTSNGGNASAAYRAAYNAGGMRPQTIHVKSCNLLKRDKVRARLQEIMAPYIAKYAISRTNLVEQLLFTSECGRMGGHIHVVCRSINRLMRMCGL